MATGFGIAALILAIVAIYVPVVGVGISALAVVFAAISGLSGGRAFSIATALIAGVNTFFLSPSLWMMQEGGPNQQRSPLVATITLAFIIVPIICMIIGTTRGQTETEGRVRVSERADGGYVHDDQMSTPYIDTASPTVRPAGELNPPLVARANFNRPLTGEPTIEHVRSEPPSRYSYDSAKWDALVEYDPDIAKIAAALKPYGAKYTDQFASAYLAINDKNYLAVIVQKIIATAKQDAAQRS